MGEWPGARSTLPRLFGVEVAPLGASPPEARCWLLAGGPLLGRGPVVGTRKEAAALGGGASEAVGRAGGGMRLDAGFCEGGGTLLGGGGMDDTFCGLFDAGKEGTVGECFGDV